MYGLTEPTPGYDHTYLLEPVTDLRPAATLSHTGSGITMTISTDAEALQFYSGNRNIKAEATQGLKTQKGQLYLP